MSEARTLVIELAVEYLALALRPEPAPKGNTRERFHVWYTFGEQLFAHAIAAGVATEADPPHDAIAELARTVAEQPLLLDALWYGLADGLGYIGYEVGYFYGGEPWDELCAYRSGVQFIAELAGLPFDTEVEATMALYGKEMFEQLPVIDGMPRRHWWWFGGEPA